MPGLPLEQICGYDIVKAGDVLCNFSERGPDEAFPKDQRVFCHSFCLNVRSDAGVCFLCGPLPAAAVPAPRISAVPGKAGSLVTIKESVKG